MITIKNIYGIGPTFPAIALNPSAFVRETEPPSPSAISAIPRNTICVPNVMIMVGSSLKRVAKNPFIIPQTVPVSKPISKTPINGTPALLERQAIVAARQTVEPTEISISPISRIYAIGNSKNISVKYFGISRSTFVIL